MSAKTMEVKGKEVDSSIGWKKSIINHRFKENFVLVNKYLDLLVDLLKRFSTSILLAKYFEG
jgi:hypothetical protein